MLHIRTQSQLADLPTKALSAHQFHLLLFKMNMINIHSPIHLEGEYKSATKTKRVDAPDKQDGSSIKKRKLKKKIEATVS